mgnify:CR=1 FL=1|jgi:hypothetical protein
MKYINGKRHLESGKVDSTIADTYITNLEEIITDSRK